MSDKQKKLLALYNDVSITIEEKRTIAVKLIDSGIVDIVAPKQKEIKQYVEYRYNGVKYKQDIHQLFESYRIMNINYQDAHNTMRRKEKKVIELESKLEHEKKIKSRLRFLFILLIIANIIAIILN